MVHATTDIANMNNAHSQNLCKNNIKKPIKKKTILTLNNDYSNDCRNQ
jgi:hypothetical protein